VKFRHLRQSALLAFAGLHLSTAPLASAATVEFTTEAGSFLVEVDEKAAPVTSSNFLQYVDQDAYVGGAFYRATTPQNQAALPVKIHIVQARPGEKAPSIPPIKLERTSETGLRHVRWAISMARGGPDTATAQFFICMDDEPELDFGGERNPDCQGFAVFGRVVKGFDVVARIYQSELSGEVLKKPVMIKTVRRLPAAQ
jgi:peptidyl-prolyl cis-trans isomerase A (cyclophilin A)